jgi:hypothetical protein
MGAKAAGRIARSSDVSNVSSARAFGSLATTRDSSTSFFHCAFASESSCVLLSVHCLSYLYIYEIKIEFFNSAAGEHIRLLWGIFGKKD